MNLPDFSQVCDSRTIPCHGLDVDIGWVPKVAGSKFCKHGFMSNLEQTVQPVHVFQAVVLTHISEVSSRNCTATTAEAVNHGNHRQARLTEGTGPRGSLVGNMGHTTHAPQEYPVCGNVEH